MGSLPVSNRGPADNLTATPDCGRWWPADPAPGSLHGKRVVVTGATSGIGEAMTQSFAELGATVHLLGRNRAKVASYAEGLRRAVPTADVVEEVCDVGDLDAVRAWCADLTGRVESMHPGWVATPGVSDSLPRFDKVMGPLLRDPRSGADTAVWLVATRTDSAGSRHFWHDRALRPTTYGWQRDEDPARVSRFLSYVSGATGTTAW